MRKNSLIIENDSSNRHKLIPNILSFYSLYISSEKGQTVNTSGVTTMPFFSSIF